MSVVNPKSAPYLLVNDTLPRSVILSVAKDLLFASIESKADPSVAQNRRDLRMTLARVFPQPL
jgi:hypothetical protein